VLAWLVLAHLLADFVFQTDAIAMGKFGDDRTAWRALGIHVGIVGLLNLPFALVFGMPGLAFAAVTVAGHLVIDRTKIVLTIRAGADARPPPAADRSEADASGESNQGGERPPVQPQAAGAQGPPLDRTWTSRPAAYFMLDQFAHVVVLLVAWAVLLARTAPLGAWNDLANAVIGTADPDAFHRFVLVCVVVADLAIVNVRAASLFVATLVRAPQPKPGTFQGRGAPSTAQIGETIGILERVIVSALVLVNALDATGLVIAAKTLARFKQLDDREFAEYYLLGTLGSISIAILSSLVARQALA